MKTAMQELKEKLQIVVNDLEGAVHGTDQYGYRGAMENVIKDIDAQMIKKEKRQIRNAYKAAVTINLYDKGEGESNDYYNETFKP